MTDQHAFWGDETQKELDRLYKKPERKVIPIAPNIPPPKPPMTRIGDINSFGTVKHTPPPPDLFWTCDVCGEVPPYELPTGRWIRRSCACEKREREEKRKEEELTEWRAAQIYRTFGGWLGEGWSDTRLAERTFARFDHKLKWQLDAWQKASRFADSMQGNVLFYGDTFGSGKTHLAAAICNALRERRVSSLFVSAPKFFAARNNLMKTDGDYHRLDKLAIITPLLVLDDVDKAHHTDPREETYWLIIDERAKAGRSTVMTANNMEGLASFLGISAVSRFMIGLQAVEMKGNDYRLKQGDKR